MPCLQSSAARWTDPQDVSARDLLTHCSQMFLLLWELPLDTPAPLWGGGGCVDCGSLQDSPLFCVAVTPPPPPAPIATATSVWICYCGLFWLETRGELAVAVDL